jgi:hypothetical protein
MASDRSQPPADVRFLKFHRENPHVYPLFVRFTRQAKMFHRGVGINAVLERARWETYLSTDGDPYKLNNNFAPYYARLIMRLNPDLNGVFTTRLSRADREAQLTYPGQSALWEEAERDDGWLEAAARDVEDST